MNEDIWMQLLMQVLGASPSYDSKNREEAWGLDQQKGALNLMQDQVQVLGDPMAAALGPSGGFDPKAFEDVIDEEYEVPTDWYAPYANLAPESMERTVADAIQGGASPTEVVQYMKDQGVGAFNGQDLEKTVLPMAQDFFGKKTDFDTQMAAIPKDAQGNPVTASYKPSEAAQVFLDAGLPLPTEQFVKQDFAPELDRQQAARGKSMEDYKNLVTTMRQNKKSGETVGRQALGARTDVLPGADMQGRGYVDGVLTDYGKPSTGEDSKLDLAALVAQVSQRNQTARDWQAGNARQQTSDKAAVDRARKSNEKISTTAQGNDRYARTMARNAAASGDNPLRRALMQRLGGIVTGGMG